MISLDSTTSSTITNPPNPASIIFECNDFRRDTGLILLKRKKEDRFELHLHDDYTNQAIAIVLDIKDWLKCLNHWKITL